MSYLSKINKAHKAIVVAMKAKRVSTYRLSQMSGVSYPVVHRFVNKKNLNITLESYFKMCDVLNIE